MTSETIAAIATPPGHGGVGIVRVSGTQVPAIIEAVIGHSIAPRTANFAVFHDADGHFIDEGIAIFFQAPKSFTGEDVLELQGHGGSVVLDLVLQRCLALGARIAHSGEFTQRAYLNGKLDLTQAEAIADLIESTTALSARLAGKSLQGVFSRRIDTLIEQLTQLRMLLEATLDFPDEDVDFTIEQFVANQLHQLIAATQQIMQEAHQGQRIREGLTVVIAGLPNAGKSSILNVLSDSDAAIVTPVPGTTRDVLKLHIQIDGLPIQIIDTAGIRDTDDLIEREGVRRAQNQLQKADLVLWIYDANESTALKPSEKLLFDCPLIKIKNKIDLLGLKPQLIETPDGVEIALSAMTGAGFDLLRNHLKTCAGVSILPEGAFIARRRHLDALRRGLQSLDMALIHFTEQSGIEFVAEELFQAQQSFGEITGKVTSDDLLGRIFSSFCIGK
ncbi:tRNA uridine-5-carboxymethylaminomethyl(34) synthesis GTPase MnmE [Chromatium weissei]|nr:tRNA uridine-5-carboxymethylaminomethyl(34) synthesis GTPase MnmE [Chromatium weissei]